MTIGSSDASISTASSVTVFSSVSFLLNNLEKKPFFGVSSSGISSIVVSDIFSSITSASTKALSSIDILSEEIFLGVSVPTSSPHAFGNSVEGHTLTQWVTHGCLKVHGGVSIALFIFVDPIQPRINCLVFRVLILKP